LGGVLRRVSLPPQLNSIMERLQEKKKKALPLEGLNLKKSYLTYGIVGSEAITTCVRSGIESVL